MSYDTKCEELAEHFLQDEEHDQNDVAELAQVIQDAVENWFVSA